jgi:hypothetical protein
MSEAEKVTHPFRERLRIGGLGPKTMGKTMGKYMKNGVLMGYMMVIQWDLMGYMYNRKHIASDVCSAGLGKPLKNGEKGWEKPGQLFRTD